MEKKLNIIPLQKVIQKYKFVSEQMIQKNRRMDFLETVKLSLYLQVINTDTNSMKAIVESKYDGWKYTDKLKFEESKFYRYNKQTS